MCLNVQAPRWDIVLDVFKAFDPIEYRVMHERRLSSGGVSGIWFDWDEECKYINIFISL